MRFCPECGAELAEELGLQDPKPQTTAPAERKPVTIFFADIVGSTEKAEALDPEEWRVGHRSEAVRRLSLTSDHARGVKYPELDAKLKIFTAHVAVEEGELDTAKTRLRESLGALDQSRWRPPAVVLSLAAITATALLLDGDIGAGARVADTQMLFCAAKWVRLDHLDDSSLRHALEMSSVSLPSTQAESDGGLATTSEILEALGTALKDEDHRTP